ncbi:TonB family protein [Ideonella sp. DXS29W]|uniref:TonB family protein n=1 Tax=Ideonella lacteola TaxID=2984193 RepID=A0ABU9BUS3_9BURK
MNYAEQLRTPQSGRHTGLVIVAAIHVLLGWALIHGLGQRHHTPPPAPIDVDFVPVEPAPPPPPTPMLPQPSTPVQPRIMVEVPIVPPIATPTENTISATHEAVTAERGWTDNTAASAASGAGTPPARMVAKPAIANVQGCAPTSDDYPAAARRAEATGTTRLRFTIDAAGALVRSEILKSAGVSREHRLLDKVAESKLAGCYFTAGIDENGRAVGGTFEVDYVWRLE